MANFILSKISFEALHPCPGLQRKARNIKMLIFLNQKSDQRKLFLVYRKLCFFVRTWREKPDKARKIKKIRFGIPTLLKERDQKTPLKPQIS